MRFSVCGRLAARDRHPKMKMKELAVVNVGHIDKHRNADRGYFLF